MESLAVTAGAFGVVSFANLVVRTIGEIHAFYSSIKDAPLTVTAILADLDLLITIIQDFASDDAGIATCHTLAIDKAWYLCGIKVRSLQMIVQELERGFASGGKRQKIWAACRTSRKKAKLDEFRSSLEDTKITLLLAISQQNKKRPSNFNGQEDTRSSGPSVVLSRRIGDAANFIVDPLVDTFGRSDVIEPVVSEPQPKAGGPGRQEKEALDDTLDQEATANDPLGIGSRPASSKPSTQTNHALSEKSPALKTAGNRASGNAIQINSEVVLGAQPTLRKSERFAGEQAPAMQRELETESQSQLKRSTRNRKYCSRPLFQSDILGTWYRWTQWTKTTIRIGNDVSEKSEVTTSFIYHPGRWQIACGFTTVLNFSLYDPYPLLTPKRAVPEGSLVFYLCQYGNIDAVRLLFERGEASVLDVDPRGYTPLHFAVGGGQYETAKFLLLHGADPEASVYEYSQMATPIGLSGFAGQHDSFRERQDIVRLFDDHIEYGKGGWEWVLIHLMTLHRHGLSQVGNEFVQWAVRFHFEKITLCEGPSVWSLLAFSAMYSENLAVLETILTMLPQNKMPPDDYRQTLFHNLLSDPDCFSRSFDRALPPTRLHGTDVFRLLCRLEQDLHTLWGGETPLSQGLWFSDWFRMWRDWVMDDLDALLGRELQCSGSPLISEGWSQRSLRLLFNLPRFEPTKEPGCCICNWGPYYEKPRGPYLLCVGSLIEPWWESVKDGIRNTECLCLALVHFRKNLLEMKLDRPVVLTEHAETCQAKQHWQPCRKELADDEVGHSSQSHNWLCRDLTRCGLQGELKRLRSIRNTIMACFQAQDGVWRHAYRPGETFCFMCLARKEGWIDCTHDDQDVPIVPGAFPQESQWGRPVQG